MNITEEEKNSKRGKTLNTKTNKIKSSNINKFLLLFYFSPLIAYNSKFINIYLLLKNNTDTKKKIFLTKCCVLLKNKDSNILINAKIRLLKYSREIWRRRRRRRRNSSR
jgi:hypothetical protein